MASLDEILPELKTYAAIVVTGPQRSGTTLGAHVLAQELKYSYVDEEDFGIHDPVRAQEFMKWGNVVLHAPGLMYCAEKLGGAVVVMRRDLHDIERSQERSGWNTAYGGLNLKTEFDKYMQVWGNRLRADEFAHVAALKYRVWFLYQEHECNAYYLDYASLSTHPLWAQEHQSFKVRQWRQYEQV